MTPPHSPPATTVNTAAVDVIALRAPVGRFAPVVALRAPVAPAGLKVFF